MNEQPTFKPGQRVTWMEQRRRGKNIIFETCAGEIVSISDGTHAYIKTAKAYRTIALTRLRLRGKKTELQEGVEAVFAANRETR